MIKKLTTALVLLMVHNFAKAQLTIYQELGKGGNSGVCQATGIYIGSSIPGGLNNSIKSIVLTQGYMATLAANEDGTGESFCYVAAVSNIDVDLSAVLQNKVSFIRVLAIGDIKKKGVCGKDNDVVAALKPAWFYDWGTADVSTSDRQYVPLAFGTNAANNLTTIANYTAKTDVNSLSGFNEPNSASQGNIPNATTAVPLFKNLLRTGYRMGSPATTEEQYNNWLATFINGAEADTIRVDYIAIHWYDWGNWSSSMNASPSAASVLTRFKAYINNVYALYHRPIWITEFNANPNRTTPTQEAFMALALDYLETETRVERYAFFFPNSSPASNSGTFSALTTLGQIYSDHTSTNSFTSNIIDTRPTTLPIKLISFNGKADNDGISLNWQTASEVNNEKFTLYHSSNGKDFSPIADIKGAGNSSKLLNYSYLDKYPSNGVNYYQLCQTDLDGKSEKFTPIAINFLLKQADEDLTVYSDFKGTQIEINWAQEETVEVSIFDLSGKRMFNDKVGLLNSKNLLELNTAQQLQANQLYVLTVTGSKKNIGIKFLSNN